jgi:hypothetical protein
LQTGRDATTETPDPAWIKDNSKRKGGIKAPLQNLKFNLKRVPLPPCCPFCRESHLDEGFSQVVKREPLRDLPTLKTTDAYAGTRAAHRKRWRGRRRRSRRGSRRGAALIETDAHRAEVAAEPDTEFVEVESEKAKGRNGDYTYEAATPDTCCNRCLREPTEVERGTAAGKNMWPTNDEKRPQDEEEGDEEGKGLPKKKAAEDGDDEDGEEE